MYSFDSLPEAREQTDALPVEALLYYAELLAFLQLTPRAGKPYNEQDPDGAMRAQPFVLGLASWSWG